jgi:hypothetical protein
MNVADSNELLFIIISPPVAYIVLLVNFYSYSRWFNFTLLNSINPHPLNKINPPYESIDDAYLNPIF